MVQGVGFVYCRTIHTHLYRLHVAAYLSIVLLFLSQLQPQSMQTLQMLLVLACVVGDHRLLLLRVFAETMVHGQEAKGT